MTIRCQHCNGTVYYDALDDDLQCLSCTRVHNPHTQFEPTVCKWCKVDTYTDNNGFCSAVCKIEYDYNLTHKRSRRQRRLIYLTLGDVP